MKLIHPPRVSFALFQRILQDARSPAAPQARMIYKTFTDYGIDPGVALAFFRKESSYGTRGIARHTKSWGNVRTPYSNGHTTTPHGDGSFATYTDWHTGVLDWCQRLKYRYIEELGLSTVQQIIPVYAPDSDGNDTELYIHQVLQWVAAWQEEESMSYSIQEVKMTRPHYQQGGNRRRAIVMHATAGRYDGDYGWLRQGGSSSAPVSCHYYIRKNGAITQFVDDNDVAWHAGRSTWVVDGKQVDVNVGLNPYSIGIELENLNDGRDPYPPEQYAAAVYLAAILKESYDIPQAQLVRHLDIAPGRKTDPAGFPWEKFVADVYGGEPAVPDPYRAPHWYTITPGGTTNIRYTPQVTADNIAAQVQAGRFHIAKWGDDEDPDYGGRWARISGSDLYIHESGVVAE